MGTSSRNDALTDMDFPREHWAQIASTNPLERVNPEMKRRTDVVGIFPNEDIIITLVGVIMLERQTTNGPLLADTGVLKPSRA